MMNLFALLSLLLVGASIISLWWNRSTKIWGTLVALSLCAGYLGGLVTPFGFALFGVIALLWISYSRKEFKILALLIVCLSCAIKLKLLPGFIPYLITNKFALGLSTPLIGLFPLALYVPLAQSKKDWIQVSQGLLLGIIGIATIAILAIFSGAIRLSVALPSYFEIRLISNLVLTAIPEEALFRGFIQNRLCDLLKKQKFGAFLAIFLTSLLFTVVHLFWAPSLGILAFTFLAGILYGTVYQLSNKIESAILCHFLLNAVHMTFFGYPG